MTALSGGAPEQAPRWGLVDTESCGSGIRFLAPSLIVWGYVDIYIGGRSTSVELRGAHEAGGRALHPRGRLVAFLKEVPSLLDHVCSQNHAPEGFIPFGLRLIFRFFETLK